MALQVMKSFCHNRQKMYFYFKVKKMKLIEAEKEKIHNQEKFARENFAGLDNIGKEITTIVKNARKQLSEIKKKKEKDATPKEEYYEQFWSIREETTKSLEILFTVLSVKLSSSLGHALNGRSTKTLKDIIKFMDKYGISDKIFVNDMSRIANTRHISNSSIIDLCAIRAAQIDDLDFIKTLEAFAEKNKTRENIFEDVLRSTSTDYGNMNNYNMTKIADKNRIAFEALVNGSENVYNYFGGSKTLSKDYILRFVVKSDWLKRLTRVEVANVLKLEPDLFDDILKHMPENLPQEIIDIFIF